jgi:hypothetical protein
MATPVGLEQCNDANDLYSCTVPKGGIGLSTGFLTAPAPSDLARLEAENRLLRIENATLHGWIAQQDEFINRLSAAARRKT